MRPPTYEAPGRRVWVNPDSTIIEQRAEMYALTVVTDTIDLAVARVVVADVHQHIRTVSDEPPVQITEQWWPKPIPHYIDGVPRAEVYLLEVRCYYWPKEDPWA